MRYDKKKIRFDNNGIAFPFVKNNGCFKYYDNVHYHTQILNLFESGQVSELTFYMKGNNNKYLLTIKSSDMKIWKEIKFREDGSKYTVSWSEFLTGGHLVEFLSFFPEYENEWLSEHWLKSEIYLGNILK